MAISGWNKYTGTGGYTIHGIAHSVADALYAIAGENGYIATSPTGAVWTQQDTGYFDDLHDVIYAGSQFVAVGDFGEVFTSPDGAPWTWQDTGIFDMFGGVAYNGTNYVVIGDWTAVFGTNGVSWMEASSVPTTMFNSIIYVPGDGLFIGVGDGGVIATSTGGDIWTAKTSGTSIDLHDVAYGGGVYVAVGETGIILTSPDANTWTSKTNPASVGGVYEFGSNLNGVAYGAVDGFVAVSQDNFVLYSADSETWALEDLDAIGGLYSVRYVNSNYLIGGTDCIFISSALGIMDLQSTISAASSQAWQRDAVMNIETLGSLSSSFSSLGIYGLSLQSSGSLVSSLGFHIDLVMILNSSGSLTSAFAMTREKALQLMSQLTGQSSQAIGGIFGMNIQSDMSGLSLHLANVDDLPDLHEAGVVWVVNMDTGASSQYEQYGFNSFFTRNGVHYGVADDGIYKLEGDDDNGQPIESLAALPRSNLGDGYLKNVPNFYVGAASTGKLILKAVADGQEYLYEARSSSEELKTHRIDLGRGLEGTFWQFTLINQDGCDFKIADIEFVPVVRKRRI